MIPRPRYWGKASNIDLWLFPPAAGNVEDITLQNQCQQDHSDHLSIAYDSKALQDVINALGSDNPGFQPACASAGPLIGNV